MSATNWRETIAGRYATVELGGVIYCLSVTRGKSVRRMYSAKWGNHWHGSVRRLSDNEDLFSGQVDKSTGAPLLLRLAGVQPFCAIKGEDGHSWCNKAPARGSSFCKHHQPEAT